MMLSEREHNCVEWGFFRSHEIPLLTFFFPDHPPFYFLIALFFGNPGAGVDGGAPNNAATPFAPPARAMSNGSMPMRDRATSNRCLRRSDCRRYDCCASVSSSAVSSALSGGGGGGSSNSISPTSSGGGGGECGGGGGDDDRNVLAGGGSCGGGGGSSSSREARGGGGGGASSFESLSSAAAESAVAVVAVADDTIALSRTTVDGGDTGGDDVDDGESERGGGDDVDCGAATGGVSPDSERALRDLWLSCFTATQLPHTFCLTPLRSVTRNFGGSLRHISQSTCSRVGDRARVGERARSAPTLAERDITTSSAVRDGRRMASADARTGSPGAETVASDGGGDADRADCDSALPVAAGAPAPNSTGCGPLLFFWASRCVRARSRHSGQSIHLVPFLKLTTCFARFF